jgi:hypothetical protein
LLSRNGIERGGFDSAGNECVLDNEVYAARNCILFDQSDADQCIRVPMKRWRRAAFLKIRVPTAIEVKTFIVANPHLVHWTVDELVKGILRFKKVSMRGQAHDALPHVGDSTLDRMIRCGAIEGMAAVVPLSGVDELVDAEIADCEGCKAKMHAPARRNSKKPMLVGPGDLAVDIQQFPCKQVGTGSLFGTLGAMLYTIGWCSTKVMAPKSQGSSTRCGTC